MEEQLHRVVEFKTETVSSDIMQQLLGEVIENMFPIRWSNEKENKGETSLTTKQILFEEFKGIKVNKESVNDFLNIIIDIVLGKMII